VNDSSVATPQAVGWIGAGRMGAAMATRLAKAGTKVTVWNRTRSKAEPLTAFGCSVADEVAELRAVARGLGVDWPAAAGREQTPAAFLAGLPRDTPTALALRRAASTLLRGAGYTAFDSRQGVVPPSDPGHAGIGAPYAHVTAPLRRLVDRFGSELCLALTAGVEVPDWLRAALPALPGIMEASDATANAVSRACVDRTEAALLADRIGEEFDAVVLRAGRPDGGPGEVYLDRPPVLARCAGPLRLGEAARVRLVEADPTTGRIAFTAARQEG
jgi:exoribonuclease R